MPLHKDILDIENKVDPEFNFKMKSLAFKHSLEYWDIIEAILDLEFKDGLHLNINSSQTFSKKLAELI